MPVVRIHNQEVDAGEVGGGEVIDVQDLYAAETTEEFAVGLRMSGFRLSGVGSPHQGLHLPQLIS